MYIFTIGLRMSVVLIAIHFQEKTTRIFSLWRLDLSQITIISAFGNNEWFCMDKPYSLATPVAFPELPTDWPFSPPRSVGTPLSSLLWQRFTQGLSLCAFVFEGILKDSDDGEGCQDITRCQLLSAGLSMVSVTA